MKKFGQQGVTLVEMLIAVGILAVLASAVMTARSFVAKQTVRNTDKAYATQKAIQMFEELKALVNGTEKSGVNVLDQYTDGSLYNNILTTDKIVDTGLTSANPADPLSGNRLTNGNWRYMRQVQVNRVANDPYTRQVIVKVWRYASDANPTQPGELLGEVGGMLRTISSVFPPTQVFDVYVLALSNVLGWFTTVPTMQTVFNSVASDIQARNPGLELRTHFIEQSGYGRDLLYKPYINSANSGNYCDQFAIPYVYFYPGLIHDDTGSTQTFFSDSQMVSIGNMLVDGSANSPPFGNYTVSDMYNTDMRYPDELVAYAAVSAAAVAAGSPVPEISYRMLLEQMNSEPQSFNNAMLVSMHGEVLPIPPIRNYSDPAKSPAAYPNVRVVTHPTNIHYNGGAVTLRVYDYYDGLDNGQDLDTLYPSTVDPSVSAQVVYFPDLPNSTTMSVSCIYGGYTTGGTAVRYTAQSLAANTQDAGSMGMSWARGSAGTGFAVTFYNTPLRAVTVVTTGAVTTGLPKAYRLYKSEYIPCPVGTTGYTPDLTTTGVTAKNTARWIIMLSNVTDGQHTVETRIGTDLTTGTLANDPENRSRTYIWMGSGSSTIVGTASCGITPWSERFQFNGDPRDCPYQDVKFGGTGVSGDSTTIDANGYNWYFKDLSGNPDGYSGFTSTTSGYDGSGSGNFGDDRDLPKYYYLFRRAMLKSHAIFTNVNGWTSWHADQGGEFGSTYAPFSQGLPFIDTPWNPKSPVLPGTSPATGVTANLQTVDEVQAKDHADKYDGKNFPLSYPTYICAMDVVRHDTTGAVSLVDGWYARWWRGEMFPDDKYASDWVPNGNLKTGSGNFYRVPFNSVTMYSGTVTTGNGFDTSRGPSTVYQKQIGQAGPAALANGSSGGASVGLMQTYNGSPLMGDAAVSLGSYYLYNDFAIPLASPVTCPRPWSVYVTLGTGYLPAEWNNSYYSNLRTKLSIPKINSVDRVFFTSEDTGSTGPSDPAATTSTAPNKWIGLGTMQMDYTSGGVTDTAFFNLSGMAPQANFGTSTLAKASLISTLRSFLDGGLYSGSAHIAQIPLVKIYTDNSIGQYSNPSAINIVLDSPVTNTLGTPVTIGSGFAIIPSGPTTNIWYRFQGVTSNLANIYTEEYTGYPVLASSTYSETVSGSPITLDVNLKYSKDGGNTWKFMQDDNTAQAGILNTSELIGPTPVTSAPITYSWNVSNTTTFPQGDYFIRAEIYRDGYPLNYAYHVYDVSINR